MSVKNYHAVPDEDYKKIAQLEYALQRRTCCKVETFENLLAKNNFNLNYQLPETGLFQLKKPPGFIGGSIFHASMTYLRYTHIESFIKRNVDITIKNADGYTVVHLAAKREYEQYLNTWENEVSPLFITRNFCKEVNSILSAHISFNIANNPCDNNGISHFHIACMTNNLEVVRFFLQNGVSIHQTVNLDSPIMPGFTPLHFAAKFCAVEVVEELLENGADIHFKDAKDMSLLHVLVNERLKIFLRMIRPLNRENSKKCQDKKRTAMLKPSEKLEQYLSKNKKIILKLLENISPNFVDSTGFTSLHAISTLGDTSIAEKFLNENNSMNLDKTLEQNFALCPGYTALHFASHFNNVDMIIMLMKRGANMKIPDAKGATAFDICLENLSLKDIHNIIIHEAYLKSIKFPNVKVKLSRFIFSMHVSYILDHHCKDVNVAVPSDSPFCAGNTPLHFAVLCSEIPKRHWDSEYKDMLPFEQLDIDFTAETVKYLAAIKLLLDLKADVTAINEQGYTPLHLAFRLQAERAVQSMLNYHNKSLDPVDPDGLSHLHIAIAARNRKVVMKLLSNGANANETTKTSFIVRPYFIAKRSTPLHFAAFFRDLLVMKALIEKGANVLAKDSEGAIPLERFYGVRSFSEMKHSKYSRYNNCPENDSKILDLLVSEMTDQIINRKENPNILLDFYRVVNINIVKYFAACYSMYETKYKHVFEYVFNTVKITKLHIACMLQSVKSIENLTKELNINAQVDPKSPFWPGWTPLHVAVEIESKDFVERLLQLGADVTLANGEHDTPIHAAFNIYRDRSNNMEPFIVDTILARLKNFDTNPVDVSGISHFHIACARNAKNVVKKFLEHKVDINQVTDYFEEPYGGFTALHFAAHHLQAETIQILLAHRANMRIKNTAGNSLLHTCFNIRLPRGDHISLNIDDNWILMKRKKDEKWNKQKEKQIKDEHRMRMQQKRDEYQKLMKQKRENVLDILIRAGVDVNEKNIFGETILRLLMKDDYRLEDVENYLNRGCHVNVCDIDGESFTAILMMKIEQLVEYQKLNPDESGRNAIHFVVSIKRIEKPVLNDVVISIEDYVTIIGKLLCLKLDINQQDNQGLTPLHTAAKMENSTAIIVLLNYGADFNVLDKNGNTAFVYSFYIADKIRDKEKRVHDQHVLKTFAIHKRKLQYFQLKIVHRNEEIYKKVKDMQLCKFKMGEGFHKEIKLSEGCQLFLEGYTLHDFLCENRAVVAYPKLPKDQQKSIDDFFKSTVLLKVYPTLSGLLLLQYRKACHLLSISQNEP